MTNQATQLQTQNEINALEKWQTLYAEDLALVDGMIVEHTQSEATLIPKIVQHIISSGGKRIRPILTILSAQLCGYKGTRHIALAAAIELFHTATLLHDDVVDESDLRRGSPTVNQVWGNAPSILVGDFLLGKAFQLLANDGSIEVLRLLSDTSAVITEGEIKQLMQVSDIETSQDVYLDIIASKTAALFTAACKVGAMVANQGENKETALYDFGQSLGVAFQIVDDALDYSSRQEELGKTIGDDFREQKVTLPVILAYAQGSEQDRDFWKRVMTVEQRDGDFKRALELIESCDVLAQTIAVAHSYAQKASECLDVFEHSNYHQALLDLAAFSVDRSQ